MSNTENQNKDKTMLIAGINIAIMLVYTLLIRIFGGQYGALGLALVIAVHFVICLLISPFIYSKGFLLSALGVLLIGFSTCYLAYTIH